MILILLADMWPVTVPGEKCSPNRSWWPWGDPLRAILQ